jgi:hypothetical protein
MHGAVDDEPKFLWGSWQEQEYEDAKKEAEAAKRQLKAARKISQGRLQRIRKLTAKIKKRGAT